MRQRRPGNSCRMGGFFNRFLTRPAEHGVVVQQGSNPSRRTRDAAIMGAQAMAKAKEDKAPKAADEETKPEGDAPAAPPKRSLKKLLLFVVAPAVLLLGGAGAYFFLFAGGEEEGAAAEEMVAEAPPVFFDLPEMLVNLAGSTDAKPVFLKLAVALELASAEEVPAIEPVLPRVLDNFQTFLRELRIEDLSGSAGMFRLKEELLRRVNLAVAPAEVRDVLFKQMLIQ